MTSVCVLSDSVLILVIVSIFLFVVALILHDQGMLTPHSCARWRQCAADCCVYFREPDVPPSDLESGDDELLLEGEE